MNFNTNEAEKLIIEHEGMEFVPYLDSLGIQTIACGWNMQANPLPAKFQEKVDRKEALTVEDCLELLRIQLSNVIKQMGRFDWFEDLSYARKSCLCDMVYNLGLRRFLGFKKLIKALEDADYEQAAREMLDSDWANQVGHRADTLSIIMKTDEL